MPKNVQISRMVLSNLNLLIIINFGKIFREYWKNSWVFEVRQCKDVYQIFNASFCGHSFRRKANFACKRIWKLLSFESEIEIKIHFESLLIDGNSLNFIIPHNTHGVKIAEKNNIIRYMNKNYWNEFSGIFAVYKCCTYSKLFKTVFFHNSPNFLIFQCTKSRINRNKHAISISTNINLLELELNCDWRS